MKTIALATLLLLNPFAQAETKTLIFDGKAYTAEEKAVTVCGDLNSPEYAAAMIAMDSAKIARGIIEAACKAGTRTDCSADTITRDSIKILFNTVRKYSSRFKSESCKNLREKCNSVCLDSGQFSADDCLIECNQYEIYNR